MTLTRLQDSLRKIRTSKSVLQYNHSAGHGLTVWGWSAFTCACPSQPRRSWVLRQAFTRQRRTCAALGIESASPVTPIPWAVLHLPPHHDTSSWAGAAIYRGSHNRFHIWPFCGRVRCGVREEAVWILR